jgi:polyisoprenoid-binding protein YceI
MMRLAHTGALAAVCLLATACGAASTAAPTSAPAPTTAPAPAPTTTVAARPTTAPAPATVAPPATATSVPTTNAAAAGTTLVIDSSASHASYHAHEQLAGRNLPSEAVGTSSSVSGSIVLQPDGSIDQSQSQIKVDLSSLASDESRRDNFIKGNTLNTSQFPMATFTPREVQGLPNPLPESGSATFQLIGDLTVHGVTKPATWQVTAQFAPTSVSGDATTDVNISDFGMTPPKAGPVLSIQDGLTLELAFTAARQA